MAVLLVLMSSMSTGMILVTSCLVMMTFMVSVIISNMVNGGTTNDSATSMNLVNWTHWIMSQMAANQMCQSMSKCQQIGQ